MQLKRPVTNTREVPPELHLMEAMIMGGSNAIEASEARGQRELSQSSQLPVKGGKKETLEALGITVIGPTAGDEIFQDVVFPEGWAVKPTEHSMWSDLVDEKGRKRAGIFYKAAFYDRSAHVNFNIRFTIQSSVEYTEERKLSTRQKVVKDWDGTVVFSGPLVDFKAEHITEWDAEDRSRKACEEWLSGNYPEWKSPVAYW